MTEQAQPSLAEQVIELDLVYLERRDMVIAIGERVRAGKMPVEEYVKRKGRLPALMAARDTLRRLADGGAQ